METSKPLMKDENAEDVDVHLYRSMISSLMNFNNLKPRPDIMFVDSPFDLEAYTHSDYAGASLDRKSTTGGCQFLGSILILWQCKKQTIVANSTTEAEYVAAASCYGQVLWIQNQMLDYGYNFMNTKIYIDNESTICIVKNPVFHSKTKHIEIRHHFIRASNEKKLIQMSKIHTDHNVADLLTKAFDVGRFQYLIATNETIIKEWEDRMEMVATTIYSLEEEQDNVKSGNSNFCNTAAARTLDNREIEITAIIDGNVKIVSEASIRRHLKLEDSDGISNVPTTKIFEQLALMGSKKASWEQFSSNIATAIICLATNKTFNFSKMIFDGMGEGSIVPVESHHTPTSAPSTSQPPSSSPSRRTTRYESVVPQPRSPTQTNVADEATSTSVDVRHGGAATIVTSLDAGQGSGNVDKTPSMPHDSPLPRVHTLGSNEGKMQHNELMDLVTKLLDGDVALETDLHQTKKVYGTDFLKLIKKVKKLEKTVKTRQARRKAKIVLSNDEEDLEDPSKQGRKIAEINQDTYISLVQHDAEVQGRHEHDMEPNFEFAAAEEVYTAKKEVSTAEPVSTVGASVSTAGASSAKDKGKAIMEEAETIQTKTKLQLE
ncbi:hypothetical protein Tco_0689282 [Tanacetum coccineum]